MAAEREPSPAADPEEQSGKGTKWGAILAVFLLAEVIGVVVYGYSAKPGWVGVVGKQFWDYLELLIVPAALALGVYWLNRAQSEREREAEEAQQERERRAEEACRERELEIENRRAQDEALQAYLDQMSRLLTDYGIPGDPRAAVNVIARASTLTVLPRLVGRRKRSVLQFLYEAGLIDKDHGTIDLAGADLREAELGGLRLDGARLRGADLRGANLEWANLRGADLRKTHLQAAGWLAANLTGADLSEAWMWDVTGMTNEELERQACCLEGATMPDGQKYEDWLKGKSGGEDRENTGPS